jgi:hypothetical protein
MKTSFLMSLIICSLLPRAQAAWLFKIPENAARELPAGVPRTVDTNGNVVFIDTQFTTPAYQEEGLRLMIEEANKAAMELRLPESLPITKTNLTHEYIGTFGSVYQDRALGNVTTSNYWYFIKRDYKLSDVTIAKIDDRCREYSETYQWPISRLDTNTAFQLAAQWLAAVHMDVKGLNRDCDVHIDLDPYWNNVKIGELPKRKFTPIYSVSWTRKGERAYENGSAANVELFLPTKTLLGLSVDDPKYILRQPVVFTNLAALFPGKATITTNWPVETKSMPRLQHN